MEEYSSHTSDDERAPAKNQAGGTQDPYELQLAEFQKSKDDDADNDPYIQRTQQIDDNEDSDYDQE